MKDIGAWLLSDIRDERFLALDRDFRKKWHGYSVGRAKIIVPRSEAVEDVCEEEISDARFANIEIKLDEYIEGKNLTELKPGKKTDFDAGILSKDDYAAVMRLIVTNYIEQILSGVVHSNPHPGNFRVSRADKDGIEVAIFDRNFYLEFPKAEIEKLRNVVANATESSRLGAAFIEAVLACDENTTLSAEKRDQVMEYVNAFSFTDIYSINEFSRELRNLGVFVPLRYTLLALNMNALNKMCLDAGLSGIAEAVDVGRVLRALGAKDVLGALFNRFKPAG